MVILSFTNMVVDDFNHRKRSPLACNYIYFLTHWHSDHYWGLTAKWNFGPIYCSEVTRRLLLTKYPKLDSIVFGLELDKQHTLFLNPEKTLLARVRLFDSNHMAGSVMILFEGYFGRVLHTGDMRFNLRMVDRNPRLFPYPNEQYSRCSIPIDEVILDNTYCDPIFKFPKRSRAMQLLCDIIDKNRQRRVFIATDSVGKEEVFVMLAKKYRTRIVVNAARMRYINCMNVNKEVFTTAEQQGWIEVVPKHQKDNKMKLCPSAIAITLTGWANIPNSHAFDNRNYIVPYSLHSNFSELEDFMRAVHPCHLKPVVKHKKGGQRVRNIRRFQGYLNTLSHLDQRGFAFFQKQYVDASRTTDQYRKCMSDHTRREEIEKELGIHSTSRPRGEWKETREEGSRESSVMDQDEESSSDEELEGLAEYVVQQE